MAVSTEIMGAMPGRAERIQMAEYTDKNEDAQTVIDALKKAVFRGRIRLTEFFSDFDPLRTGYMSSAKFRTALMASGAMPLSGHFPCFSSSKANGNATRPAADTAVTFCGANAATAPPDKAPTAHTITPIVA